MSLTHRACARLVTESLQPVAGYSLEPAQLLHRHLRLPSPDAIVAWRLPDEPLILRALGLRDHQRPIRVVARLMLLQARAGARVIRQHSRIERHVDEAADIAKRRFRFGHERLIADLEIVLDAGSQRARFCDPRSPVCGARLYRVARTKPQGTNGQNDIATVTNDVDEV